MSFDILIGAITIFFIIRGWIKGFIEEALNLVFIVLTIYLSLKLRPNFAHLLDKIIGHFYFNNLISFVLLILMFSLICLIVGKYLVEPVKNIKIFNTLDKIFGAFTGILISVFITFGISYFIMFFLDPVILQKSKIFPYYEKIFKIILNFIKNEVA